MGGFSLWAQVPGTDPAALPLLALRRWFVGLTLSSPEPTPSSFGFGVWLIALAVLLMVVLAAQGPVRAIRQFFDVPGHLRLASAAMDRLRASARLVAILFGATVLSWTAWQSRFYNTPERLEDLVILLKNKSAGEIAVEQGVLAALTPLRDLCGLGDTMVLLLAAAAFTFKFSADRWGASPAALGAESAPPGTTVAWGAAWIYALYRFAAMVVDPDGMPLGGCLFLEPLVVPVLMLLADALLLGWVLVELRGAATTDTTDESPVLDVAGVVAIMPQAALVCLAALPARYVATAAWLSLVHFQSLVSTSVQTGLLSFIRGRGLIALQAGSLVLLGLAGAAPWYRAGIWRGFGRLLRAEGARLIAILVGAGLAAGVLSGLAYQSVLSLPAQPWVLAAADSYAHYATLPVGLLLLATLVELGSRVQPPPEPSPATVEPPKAEPLDFERV